MHSIAEIVIPPTTDIHGSIEQIMDSFKNDPDEDEEEAYCDWWDFWVIGGRFSGAKLEATIDPVQMAAFNAACKEAKITVSGMQCGKQEINPPDQIPLVDELWRKHVPGKGHSCILFKHGSKDQYGKKGIDPNDVCTIAQIPDNLQCERLIVAGHHWKDKTKLQAKRMLVTEFWNKTEWQDTKFDGKVKPALEFMLAETEKHNQVDATPEWLVVTVDYHN